MTLPWFAAAAGEFSLIARATISNAATERVKRKALGVRLGKVTQRETDSELEPGATGTSREWLK